MPSIDYMKAKKPRRYYEIWADNPLFTQQYKEYFYKFVKACIEVDKKPDTEYLKLALYDSFHEQYDKKQYNEFTDEVIILFEHLINFSNTTLE
jgi:hypothetical protein